MEKILVAGTDTVVGTNLAVSLAGNREIFGLSFQWFSIMVDCYMSLKNSLIKLIRGFITECQMDLALKPIERY